MSIARFTTYLRYEKNYSSHTVLSYKADLQQFVSCVEREQEGAAFDPSLIDRSLVRRYISTIHAQGVSPRSIARKVSALRSYFSYLVKEHVVSVSPVASVTLPRVSKNLPVFMREEEMNTLLDGFSFDETFQGVRDKLLLTMLYTTGMRRSELIALKDADVNQADSSIKVTGKRNKQRIIPFGGELSALLCAYIQERNEVFGGVSFQSLFVRDNGEPLYPGWVYRVVTRYLSLVTTHHRVSPHVLRHSFASAMLNNGSQLSSVKELLGHHSLTSTQVYTHISFEDMKKSYKQAHPRAIKK